MKKLIFVLGLLIAGVSYSEEKSAVTEVVSSVVSGVVSTGKNVLKGVKEGVDTGRKEGKSIDEAFIIYDKEQFEENVKAEVLSVTKDDIGYKVTVGLRNETDRMIRLTNLNEQKSLQLLDSDGFAVFAQELVEDINIPKKAAVKSSFRFPADGQPAILKIYEREIKINSEVLK
ncbi:hypothetical protein [uncultured Fusobacterium sp.]|uniref:hypothetical protein n=1 Tax=uncultured Fusobacterium sp. TaxID=159267 RepID=UPI00280566BB|nr:hypothetical protein [uncultured Fusobacterium sp.]